MKTILRKDLLQFRALISLERRQEASKNLLELLTIKLEKFSNILSFASFGDEINLWPTNQFLIDGRRLHFPRIAHEKLEICAIQSLESDLQKSCFGMLEPRQEIASIQLLDTIECVLVPGIGFDLLKNRIGYGKGHYDRLLKKMPFVHKIGVGFKEQLLQKPIPIEAHDIALDELILL